jgi:hypothetical protein
MSDQLIPSIEPAAYKTLLTEMKTTPRKAA